MQVGRNKAKVHRADATDVKWRMGYKKCGRNKTKVHRTDATQQVIMQIVWTNVATLFECIEQMQPDKPVNAFNIFS